MKLTINYDLMEKIVLAKKGFSLKKTLKTGIALYPIAFALSVPTNLDDPKQMFTSSIIIMLYYYLLRVQKVILLSSLIKEKSFGELVKLSNYLESLNISTSASLLLNSKVYDTLYKVELDDAKIPYLLQKKYIMVPAYDSNGIGDISILQEHVIGSRDYVLSLGSPSKILKLAPSGI